MLGSSSINICTNIIIIYFVFCFIITAHCWFTLFIYLIVFIISLRPFYFIFIILFLKNVFIIIIIIFIIIIFISLIPLYFISLFIVYLFTIMLMFFLCLGGCLFILFTLILLLNKNIWMEKWAPSLPTATLKYWTH